VNEKERWESPEHRLEIENAIKDTYKNHPESIGAILYCIKGAPWEEWAKKEINDYMRVKFYLENIPRFV
jgi:hypothetical protein